MELTQSDPLASLNETERAAFALLRKTCNTDEEAMEKLHRALEEIANIPEEAQQTAMRQMELVRIRERHRSFYNFVVDAWHIVVPDAEFKTNWHIRVICKKLQKFAYGRGGKLLINVPPGAMKSLLVSVFFPAWVWRDQPGKKFIAASYSDHIVKRDNGNMHDLVASAWYKELYRVKFSPNQEAKGYFKNVRGGWRFGTTPRGTATGEHPDFIIIDDPHSSQQAESDAERNRVLGWYDKTISSRGYTRGVNIVVIMQRLHQNDLSGHLLSKGSWDHICFPMEYEKANDDRSPDPLDPRTEEGQLLWPSLITQQLVDAKKIEFGAYAVAGQFQQRPAPLGGGLFLKKNFQILETIPKDWVLIRKARGWDTAATEDGGDYTAGTLIGMYSTPKVSPVFIIEDLEVGQFGPKEVDDRMHACAMKDGRLTAIREEKEPGSAGKTVIDTRKSSFIGFDYEGVQLTGSKVVRAGPFRSALDGMSIFYLRAPWNSQFFAQMDLFPNGVHDDVVDSTSCSFNALNNGPRPARARKVSWG